jgi:hypothetical protein
MNQNQSLIFIPDISGYTNFVNNTELSHQAHILTELLNLLIESNEIGLELAEVEGDALFYYKTTELPGFEELVNQVKQMFIRFHSHLRYYDKYRLCHCGACSETTGLNLKFVVHIGELGFLKLKGQKSKPHGKEVILAHRVLKNDVPGNEYLLMTDASLSHYKIDLENSQTEFNFTHCQTDYGLNDLGEVRYCYSELGHFKSLVNEPMELVMESKVSKPLKFETQVNAKPVDLFEYIINFEHRQKWATNINSIEYNEKELNQVGSQHFCIIDNKKINVQSVTSDFGENKWVYGEKSKVPMMKEIIVYYIIEPLDGGSLLKVEVHPKPKPIIGHIFLPILKNKFKTLMSEGIGKLKTLAESNN